MKKAIHLSLLTVLAGLAVWLGLRGFFAEKDHSIDAGQTSGLEGLESGNHVSVTSTGEMAVADNGAERLRRLLADATALLEQVSRLSSDDMDEFHKLSDLNNEFVNSLDKEKAALLVKHMPSGFVTTGVGDQVLRFWAKADRAAAAEWMADHPSDSPIPAAAIAHDWITQDAAGLRAYVDRLPTGPWKQNVTKSAGEDALVDGNPCETIRLLDRIQGDDPRRDELYERAATSWALEDPTAAAHWASETSDSIQREKRLSAVAVGYANENPQQAANWALETIKDQDALNPALTAVVRIWANQDAAMVAEWVQQFPNGAIRDSALDGLLAIWMANDSKSAMAWQQSLNDPAMRERSGKIATKYAAELKGELSIAP